MHTVNEGTVIRLVKSSKDGKASITDFQLSDQDELENPPSMSVWDNVFTTPKQALLHFHIDKRVLYKLFASLNSDFIRKIDPHPIETPITPYLNVIWSPFPDNHPSLLIDGAKGHCGIIGFKRASIDNRKNIDKSLRYKLTEYANQNLEKL